MKIYIYIAGLVNTGAMSKPSYFVTTFPTANIDWELVDVIDHHFTADKETLMRVANDVQEKADRKDADVLYEENQRLKRVIEEMKRDSHDAEEL